MSVEAIGPEAFFQSWLPARFAELKEKSPQLAAAQCSLLAQVGEAAWSLKVGDGELSVDSLDGPAHAQVHEPSSAMFRFHTTHAAFNLLLASAFEHRSASAPALKLLQLDPEVGRLAGAVPACLQLRVIDGAASHVVVFGPGNQPQGNVGCTLECELADVQAMQRGECDPMELFMSGRLRLEGDLQVAMALGGIFL